MSLDRTIDVLRLGRITQDRETIGLPIHLEIVGDVRDTTHRHHDDGALLGSMSEAGGERLDGTAIRIALDQHCGDPFLHGQPSPSSS